MPLATALCKETARQAVEQAHCWVLSSWHR